MPTIMNHTVPTPAPETVETQPLRAFIVDDDANIRNLVGIYCERYFGNDVVVVGMAEGADAAITLLNEQDGDIVFLDIDLTDGNGFEVLDALPAEKRERLSVIFITSHKQHAQLAIRYDAVDYIDKPILAQDFKLAVGRAIGRTRKTQLLSAELEHLRKPRLKLKVETGTIEIRSLNGTKFIAVKDIAYAKALRNYCSFTLTNHTQYETTFPLKHYEDILLDNGCVRITRSCIVHTDHVTFRVDSKGEIIALLPGGEEIVASPMFSEELKMYLP